MPVQGVKAVASARNGVGAFILQCKRLDLHYCDWSGSSRGMNAFLLSPLLPSLSTTHASTEIRISPRPNHHPVLKASYINGREKTICVRGMDANQIAIKAKYLLENSGMKNKKIRGKNVVSVSEGVRGIWSPMHGGLRDV